MILRNFTLALVLFLSSTGGLIMEIVAGRLIAPYVGMSLYTWTSIIAVVLAGLSAGHWVGGRLVGPAVSEKQAYDRLTAALAGACVTAAAALVLIRVISGPLISSDLSPIPTVILLTSCLFFLPSLFVGIVAPIVTKLAVDGGGDATGPVIGRMYAIGTIGSIVGTLAAGYVFISWIGSIGTVISVTLTYGGLAIVVGVMRRTQIPKLPLVLMTAALFGLGFWGSSVQALTSPCDRESDYFCIRVDDVSAATGRPSRLMALDHLVHSINDQDDPGFLHRWSGCRPTQTTF